MPIITFDRFEQGIDRRKGRSVSDANRLYELKNAYITPGWNVRKRPGTRHIARLSPGSKGLHGFDGKLYTFSGAADPSHTGEGVEIENVQLVNPNASGSEAVKVHYVDTFNGQLYVSIGYTEGSIVHFYNGSHVSDADNPDSASAVKLQQKIYAIDGDTVAYSATDDPTDWSTVSDAGFLPTGIRSPGSPQALAVAEYDGQLVVAMIDSLQVWIVDADPANNGLDRVIQNVGTRFPRSMAPVSRDLFFLSDSGFRSIARQTTTENLEDLDVGTPIDPLVTPLLDGDPVVNSIYYPGLGQYLGAIDSTVFAFSFSRSSKVNAWSRYEFPFSIDDWAKLGSRFFIRSGDDVYELDEDVYTDDGQLIDVEFETAFQSFKKPSVQKQLMAFDFVGQGNCQIQHRWDSRDTDLITDAITLTGNTRPGPRVPVEMVASEVATRITHSADEPFQIDAFSYEWREYAQRS